MNELYMILQQKLYEKVKAKARGRIFVRIEDDNTIVVEITTTETKFKRTYAIDEGILTEISRDPNYISSMSLKIINDYRNYIYKVFFRSDDFQIRQNRKKEADNAV